MEGFNGNILRIWTKFWVHDHAATHRQVLLETLDSQPQNDPSSNEADKGEQEDGYNNTADDSTLDNLDSSEASGSGTPTVIRSRTPS